MSFKNQRPRFFEGQYLGAEDLSAAVEYSRIQQARHLLGAHTWGIATGLQLKETPLPGGRFDMHILPGYAWDGFGRPIVILAPYKIPTELFKPYVFDAAIDNGTPEGRLIEVWLRYDEARTRNVRPGFEVCDTEDQRSRVQETFRVEVGARPNHIDRHDRITVAGNPIDAQEVIQKFDPQTSPVSLFDESVPYQDLPDSDAKARWLVPLGYVRWKPNPNPNQPGNFVKRDPQDLAKSRTSRRYIGVVAESVQAADGILRLRDRTRNYSSVQSNDLVWVEGTLRVDDNVRLFGSNLEFRHKDGRDFDVPLKVQRTGDPGPGDRALQVIVGLGSQTNNRFAVGPLKADGTVDEKFIVLSGGNVGIGTTAPSHVFHVLANEAVGLLESTTTQAYLRLATSEGFDNRVEITNRPGGRLSLFTKAGDVLNITKDGNVGIGTETPSDKLHLMGDLRISGTARKPGGGSWTDPSDARLKKNIEPLPDALNKLLQLCGVRFEWQEPEKMGNLVGPQFGLVAQEVEKVFPEWVSTGPDGYKELTIRGFEALTIEALRELKAEIDSLSKKRTPK